MSAVPPASKHKGAVGPTTATTPTIYDELNTGSVRKISAKKKRAKHKDHNTTKTADGVPVLEMLLPVRAKWKSKHDTPLFEQCDRKALVLDRISRSRTTTTTTTRGAKINKITSAGKLRIPKREQKYALYEPLAQLWSQYVASSIATDTNSNNNNSKLGERILRMDLHGAVVEVVRSKDPGLVGKKGILIAETANTILVVLKENRVITIPKNVSVIRFAVGDTLVELMLPALTYRSSERSARKMKKVKAQLLI